MEQTKKQTKKQIKIVAASAPIDVSNDRETVRGAVFAIFDESSVGMVGRVIPPELDSLDAWIYSKSDALRKLISEHPGVVDFLAEAARQGAKGRGSEIDLELDGRSAYRI